MRWTVIATLVAALLGCGGGGGGSAPAAGTAADANATVKWKCKKCNAIYPAPATPVPKCCGMDGERVP